MLDLQTAPEAPQTQSHVSPELIFETLNRYQHTMALKGAIDLDLFSGIAGGATTSRQLAVHCHASERGIRILCDFLTILGFLTKNGAQYGLTENSSFFLDRRSPAYMGSVSKFLVDPNGLAHYRDVAALVRKGGTLDGTGVLEDDAAVWVEFARSMVPMIMPAAQAMAAILSLPGRTQKVLDIAAGHGMFGISLALRNPAAQVYSLDYPQVLAVAMENAASARVNDRVHPIPGSVFETDLGSGYDLVLIPNFLHHFDPDTNVALLRRVRAALKPGGTVATLEFVPNEDRVSPPIAASFSMIMLGKTEAGDAYTFRELNQMFHGAGFGESSIQTIPPGVASLILTAHSDADRSESERLHRW